MTIYDFTSYRDYLTKWLESQGVRSYGMKGQIAEKMGVSSSLVSQILKGDKTLTPDQTSDLSDFIGLSENESDYLHLLVDLDRAGNHRYQEKLRRKIQAQQERLKKISSRVPKHKELNDEQRAIYYSSWLYTGIRNLTAVPGRNNVNSIAEHLHIEPAVVAKAVRFLLENGMCLENENGITYGPASIFVDKESPFVNKHHQNWRFQAIQKMESRRDDDLFFTSPLSLSRKAAAEIRKLLPGVIQDVFKISGPSDSEVTACLGIDWFEY